MPCFWKSVWCPAVRDSAATDLSAALHQVSSNSPAQTHPSTCSVQRPARTYGRIFRQSRTADREVDCLPRASGRSILQRLPPDSTFPGEFATIRLAVTVVPCNGCRRHLVRCDPGVTAERPGEPMRETRVMVIQRRFRSSAGVRLRPTLAKQVRPSRHDVDFGPESASREWDVPPRFQRDKIFHLRRLQRL